MTRRSFTPTLCVATFIFTGTLMFILTEPGIALGIAAILAAISVGEHAWIRWEATGWALPWDKPDTRFAKQHRPSQRTDP